MSPILKTVNPCFPRSGHRFLRNIFEAYFDDQFVFGSVHNAAERKVTEDTNYIKDHDTGLLSGKSDRQITSDARYLVQYRHPLESIQSYFEFIVCRGKLEDSPEKWAGFLPQRLRFWKAFVRKWCLDPGMRANDRVHRVQYDALYSNTVGEAEKAISFLTGGQVEIDHKRLESAVGQFSRGFCRYRIDDGMEEKLINARRDVREFRYFNDDFYRLEEALARDYLEPLGIPRLFGDTDATPPAMSVNLPTEPARHRRAG
ncbi:hypothetical protein [Aliiruegeria haliotis]|nr:hypothetical protein [Aliiruegeria haliotis]